MAGYDRDEVPMLSDTHPALLDEILDSQFQASTSCTRSMSISIPMSSMESYQTGNNLVGSTGPLCSARRTPSVQMSGPLYIDRKPESFVQKSNSTPGSKQVEPKAETFGHGINNAYCEDSVNAAKNEHLMRSGQLGMCDNPYCTTCPSYYNAKAVQHKHSRDSSIIDPKFHNPLYGDAEGWARRLKRAIQMCIPGVMNPHAKVVRDWNTFFVICYSVAMFLDPLFFILFFVHKDNKCIAINWPITKTMVVFRSLTDLVYLLNILLKFRLAYVVPKSTFVGAGEFVDNPTKIAQNYLKGWCFVDLFVVLPLPQMVLLVLPKYLGSSGANYTKNLLQAAILFQYTPRLLRFQSLLVGQSPSGLIFETVWANIFINLFFFMLCGHVIGSCWYIFGLQRVNQCLREACNHTGFRHLYLRFIDCGDGNASNEYGSDPNWKSWTTNENATACFTGDSFAYGIYKTAVNLASENIMTRYVFSLFWGFQQICTLAGNQQPSFFIGEVLFTMLTIGLGLLLLAFLIGGNMQSFLQALGRRRLELLMRQLDVQQWMSHRRLPQELRRRVLEAERYNWAATRGVDEGMLIENLPEDLQRDLRRHLFKFIKTVWIFALMDRHILDAICERLKQTIYIEGSEIFYPGGVVDKMVFIVRGKLESMGQDTNVTPLCEGGVCGEELLTWFLEHASVSKDGKKIKVTGQRLLSTRTVRCLSNVEAFSLRAADLEEVTDLYSRSLRNLRIQGAIRYQSPYWRCIAATRIQVAWRYRRRRRGSSSEANHHSSS